MLQFKSKLKSTLVRIRFWLSFALEPKDNAAVAANITQWEYLVPQKDNHTLHSHVWQPSDVSWGTYSLFI